MKTALTEPRTVERLLRAHRLRARKPLGQHFLTDEDVLEDIVAAADLSPEVTVLEVGPGLGTLTEALVRRAGRVVAVEFDPDLAAVLAGTLGEPPNLEVISGSITAFQPELHFSPRAYRVVANIPYYLTGELLARFLESPCPPDRMVLLVQREVALRLVGKQGDWSTLTVATHLFSQPRLVRTVGAQSFTPAPRVDSALVSLEVLPQPALEVEPGPFLRFVEAVFQHRRKQLHNTLGSALGAPPDVVAGVLAAAAIEPSARPQTLDLEAWGRLYQEALRRVPPSSP